MWSTPTLAEYLKRREGISVSWHYIARIWRRENLKAHRSGTLKTSKDPAFAEKVADFVSLYLAPPGGGGCCRSVAAAHLRHTRCRCTRTCTFAEERQPEGEAAKNSSRPQQNRGRSLDPDRECDSHSHRVTPGTCQRSLPPPGAHMPATRFVARPHRNATAVFTLRFDVGTLRDRSNKQTHANSLIFKGDSPRSRS